MSSKLLSVFTYIFVGNDSLTKHKSSQIGKAALDKLRPLLRMQIGHKSQYFLSIVPN